MKPRLPKSWLAQSVSDVELISNKDHVLHIERCNGKTKKKKINLKSILNEWKFSFAFNRVAVCAVPMEKYQMEQNTISVWL